MEKVSVIVPVYNAEKYIGNCINSILSQSYPNIELILVNDGSSDNSEEICQSFAKANSNILYIKQKNKGVSEARNLGVEKATGTYILFVDSDDMIEIETTKKMVNALERWHVHLVISCFRKTKSYEQIDAYNDEADGGKYNLIFDERDFYDKFASMFFEIKNLSLFTPWAKLYLHSIIKENEIKFPPNIHYGEDMWFNLQYYKHCKGVVILRECLYNYLEINPESLEAKFKKDLFYNQKELYIEIKKFLIDKTAYCGLNVIYLSQYFVYRVFMCLRNISNSKGMMSFEESFDEIKQIIDNEEVRKCFLYCDLKFNIYDQYLCDLLIAKDYMEMHNVLRNPEKAMLHLESMQSTERDAIFLDNDPAFQSANILIKSYRWLKRTVRSIRKYGVAITVNRVVGKLYRFIKKGQ